MGRVKDHLIDICELFGRDPCQLDTEDDWHDAQALWDLIADLDDHAMDYGRRVQIDTANHSIRLVRGSTRAARSSQLRAGPASFATDLSWWRRIFRRRPLTHHA